MTGTKQWNVGHVYLQTVGSGDVFCKIRVMDQVISPASAGCSLGMCTRREKHNNVWRAIGGIFVGCFDTVSDGAAAGCNSYHKSIRCCGGQEQGWIIRKEPMVTWTPTHFMIKHVSKSLLMFGFQFGIVFSFGMTMNILISGLPVIGHVACSNPRRDTRYIRK